MEIKLACPICGGKGGWKTKAEHWLDDPWQDCVYCNSLGFVLSDKEKNEMSLLLVYNGYKKIITDIMENFGKIIAYKTANMAEIIEIEYIPKDKIRFAEFANKLLKFGHYNSRMGVEIQQVFFYEPSANRLEFYWRILLKPDELKDLDGFIDIIKAWGEMK